MTDFEGRTPGPGADRGTLVVTGKPAHIILRRRFAPSAVWRNGRKPDIRTDQRRITVEFDHTRTTTLRFSTTPQTGTSSFARRRFCAGWILVSPVCSMR
jgi:hypothetical protein